MDNPLVELDAWWDAAAPEDGNAYTRLTRFETSEETDRLDFETVDDANVRAAWRLEIGETERLAWRDVWGEPQWHEEHPLLIPYRSTGAILSFAKPLDNPLRAWGAVARAHRALVGDWFPLERFFRTDLLEARFGMLASGPQTLLDAYADALRSVGEAFGYAEIDPPRRERPSPPSVVTWGESYFVARAFRLERTA